VESYTVNSGDKTFSTNIYFDCWMAGCVSKAMETQQWMTAGRLDCLMPYYLLFASALSRVFLRLKSAIASNKALRPDEYSGISNSSLLAEGSR
jgi:hypothetical protein